MQCRAVEDGSHYSRRQLIIHFFLLTGSWGRYWIFSRTICTIYSRTTYHNIIENKYRTMSRTSTSTIFRCFESKWRMRRLQGGWKRCWMSANICRCPNIILYLTNVGEYLQMSKYNIVFNECRRISADVQMWYWI
jgi:hypothetical protein